MSTQENNGRKFSRPQCHVIKRPFYLANKKSTRKTSYSSFRVVFVVLFVQVQENETKVSEQPSVSTVTVELTRPTLDTLLDGMGRIRDQLSSVAGRK